MLDEQKQLHFIITTSEKQRQKDPERLSQQLHLETWPQIWQQEMMTMTDESKTAGLREHAAVADGVYKYDDKYDK